jgi:hypothetical protein
MSAIARRQRTDAQSPLYCADECLPEKLVYRLRRDRVRSQAAEGASKAPSGNARSLRAAGGAVGVGRVGRKKMQKFSARAGSPRFLAIAIHLRDG